MQFQSVVALAFAAVAVSAQSVSNSTGVSNGTVASTNATANSTSNNTNSTGHKSSSSKISTGAAIANSMNVGTVGAAMAAAVAFLL